MIDPKIKYKLERGNIFKRKVQNSKYIKKTTFHNVLISSDIRKSKHNSSLTCLNYTVYSSGEHKHDFQTF